MNGKLSSWLKKEIKLPFPPRQKRQPSPWVRVIFKIFGWLLCALLLWFVIWRISLYREINEKFAGIRSAGLPTSGQELNSWPGRILDSENGALILTQAFALARTYPDGRSNAVVSPSLLERTNQWSAETREMITGYVQTNDAVVAKIRDAAKFLRFRFATDFAYGLDTEMPHLSQLKVSARLLALKGALAAEEGRADECADQTTLLLDLSSALDEDPDLISYLVRSSTIGMAIKTVERGLNRTRFSSDKAKELQVSFGRMGKTNLLSQALIGERAIAIPVFRLSRSEIKSLGHNDADGNQTRKPQRYSGKPMFILWVTGFFERDLDFYLETMEKSIRLANRPPAEDLGMTDELDKASEVARKKACLYSAMLLPAFSSAVKRQAATQARIELAQVALAAEQFQNQHGRWPENLKTLTPQFIDSVPADPFDGQPLRYRLLTNGYVIYSVAADGHDDGGREGPDRKKSTDTNSYDITFTVER